MIEKKKFIVEENVQNEESSDEDIIINQKKSDMHLYMLENIKRKLLKRS